MFYNRGTYLVLLLLEVLLEIAAISLDLSLRLILGTLNGGTTSYDCNTSVSKLGFSLLEPPIDN